jgi:hypothetical protein
VEYIGREGDQARYLLDIGHEMTLLLGSERELQFRWDSKSEDLLYLETPSQPRRLVGVRIHSRSQRDKEVLQNPLATLTDSEVRGLWGVDVLNPRVLTNCGT